MNLLNKIFGGLKVDINSLVDNLSTTKEEKMQLKIEMDKVLRNHEQSMFQLEVEDRKSARNMYQDDSQIQKILAFNKYTGLQYHFRYFICCIYI